MPNSAAIALAEKNCWLRKDFVDMMRAKLLEWGIQDATVVNTTGLNNETLGDNIYPGSKKMMKTSSVLMMLLSLLAISSKSTHKSWKSPKNLLLLFAGMTITSTNYMLEGMPAYRGGFDGL